MIPEQARNLVALIREKYPTPVSLVSKAARKDGSYCVAGSLAQHLGRERCSCLSDIGFELSKDFPGTQVVARLLQHLNPDLDTVTLSTGTAERYAASIVQNNDGGNFEESYNELGRALAYPYKYENLTAIKNSDEQTKDTTAEDSPGEDDRQVPGTGEDDLRGIRRAECDSVCC